MNRTTDTDKEGLLVETTIAEISLWYDLHRLQEHYVGLIDTDRLEEWPELFTEDGIYEIVPKENADIGLPMGIMHCLRSCDDARPYCVAVPG